MNLHLQLFLSVFLSWLYVPFRGKATKKVDPKKIVIVNNTGNVGDVLLTTPMFRAVKKAFPQSFLCVVGTPKNGELLWGNKDIDLYINGRVDRQQLWKEIKKHGFDFGVVVNSNPVDEATLFLAGVKLVTISEFIFSRPVATRVHTMLSPLFYNVPMHIGEYMPMEYLRFLEPIGITSTDTTKHLYVPEASVRNNQVLFAEHDVSPEDLVIAVSPGAGTKSKQWPADRFAAIAEYLVETYNAKLFIIGGPGDKKEVEEFFSFVKSQKNIVDVCGQSINDLKALLAQADMVIANDSAPIYFSEAFGKATVVLVGPTNEKEHPPQGPMHKTVMAKDRKGPLLFSHVPDHTSLEDGLKMMDEIHLEQVKAEVDDLIHIISQKTP